MDGGEGGLQVDGHPVEGKPLPQVGAVGQTHALLSHQVVFHLDDHGLLALEGKGRNIRLVGDCKQVGNVKTVIWGAYEAAMKI